ncbi:hypothetical protein [Leifsonia sp. NPDC080035]|uniref:Glucose-6-phosphate 1-epimerase n=1 Tax=Leifsonia sp. NPDC080035 TaxID=3143936 RepID=A0AAU7GCJ4_9MICO
MASTVRRVTDVLLRAGETRATVHPDYGCLISSFAIGGVEFLYRREDAPSVLPPLGPPGRGSERDFDDGIFRGGWFPMFPVAGMPDDDTWQHGWAPRVAWRVSQEQGTRLRTEVSGDFLDGGGAAVTRDIRVAPGILTVTTSITNRGTGVRSYTFGEHPCFPRALFAGGAVVSPRRLPVAAHADGWTGHARWMAPSLTVAAPRGGPSVTVDAEGLPFGVLWSNYASEELPDVDCLAWEPCTSRGLGIVDARASRSVTSIRPGETQRYRVRIGGRPDAVSTMGPKEER